MLYLQLIYPDLLIGHFPVLLPVLVERFVMRPLLAEAQ